MRNPFQKTRISVRMILISVFYTIPLVVMAWMMIGGINANIRFARWEIKGNDYQRPLMGLLHLLHQHHLAIQTGSRSQLSSFQSSIDQAFVVLAAAQSRYGEDLGFTPAELSKRNRSRATPELVQQKWSALKTSASTLSPVESREKHNDLIADVRMMITHVGDLSNLVLDPDLDSYYLMDATLVAIPQLQDRLGSTVADFVQSGGSTTGDPKPKSIAVAAALLRDVDLARVQSSIETALNEDANFYGVSATLDRNLKGRLSEFCGEASEFVTLLEKAGAGDKVAADRLASAGSSTCAKLDSLWQSAVTELDELLQLRIDAFEKQRLRGVSTASCVFMFSVVLVWLISASLVVPLKRIVNSLTGISTQVSGSISNLAASSEHLAEGAGEQSSSIEETSAALEVISSMIQQTAGNVQKAKQVSNETRLAADLGAREMEGMTRAVDEIKSSSDSISRIIKTIDEIAFQTNLLALNAAVEAARAGEAGAGFAVVADEVRALAQRSAGAARETASKIEDCIFKSDRGVEYTAKVAASLGDIVMKARQMDDLTSEIATASREQGQGITQINSAIAHIDRATRNAAESSSEIAESASLLKGQSSGMSQIVLELEGLVGGIAGARGTVSSKLVDSRSGAGQPELPPLRRELAGRTVALRPSAASVAPERGDFVESTSGFQEGNAKRFQPPFTTRVVLPRQ